MRNSPSQAMGSNGTVVPDKFQAPTYVKKKPGKNTFRGSRVVSIEFSITPQIALTIGESLVFKVLAVKEDETTQDVTNLSVLSIDDDDLADIYPTGLLVGNTSGVTTVRATFLDFEISEPVIVTGAVDWYYFRWTVVGTSSDFVVTIPVVQLNDAYTILAQLVNSADNVGLYLPNVLASDRIAANFRVITTSNLTIGDQIDFLIIQ